MVGSIMAVMTVAAPSEAVVQGGISNGALSRSTRADEASQNLIREPKTRDGVIRPAFLSSAICCTNSGVQCRCNPV
jgi:hypothetical protein